MPIANVKKYGILLKVKSILLFRQFEALFFGRNNVTSPFFKMIRVLRGKLRNGTLELLECVL